MNTTFPNFDFDIWLQNFIELFYSMTEEDQDDKFIRFVIDSLPEAKEIFFDQDHLAVYRTEEDLGSYYLENITYFSEFMRFLTYCEDRSLLPIITGMLNLRFPSIRSESIAKNLILGKSYRTKYNKSYTITLVPSFVDKVKQFIVKFEIPVKNDN